MATNFFDEWRVADRKASAAEKTVLMAVLASLDHNGPPPTPEDEAAAKKLRAIANTLFADTMAEFEEKARQLKRR